MWINSQKDNEYFPFHFHVDCALSGVMYLKIPEYLPIRKNYNNLPAHWADTDAAKGVEPKDGAIEFSNNVAKGEDWGVPTMTVLPEVGDFFIFPSQQLHQVYPFRTPDGKGERRSVSFNAEFTSRSEQDALQNQQSENPDGLIYFRGNRQGRSL